MQKKMHIGFFSDIVLCLFFFFCKILTSPTIFKYHKILSNLLNTDSIIWRILLLYYLNARNLVYVALNKRKMIFWFNHQKVNLRNIAYYPCNLQLKFLLYRINKVLWGRFNQQNHKYKKVGWKKNWSKKFA